MSYTANVFGVMIASPGDVASERSIAREVLAEWNAVNSRSRGIVLLPVGWDTHSSPEMGERPQAIINRQVLDQCDLLIGVFWTRLGTPTGEHDSGTVEEIERHIGTGKPVMLYFSGVPVHPDSVDHVQYARLKAFREQCQARGLLETYGDLNEFRAKLYRHLQLKVNEHPLFAVADTPNTADSAGSAGEPAFALIPSLSREGKLMLTEAAHDAHGYILHLRHLGGTMIQTNGKSLVEGNDPRSIATWEAAMEELEAVGLIEATSYKREIFKVTRRGYEVADALGA